MIKKIQMIVMILCGAALLSAAAAAQHRDDSIEESWDRAAREKAQPQQQQPPQQQQENYRWQSQQQPRQEQPREPVGEQRAQWPYLPPNPAAQDFYNANQALIDSLNRMYCVSSSYLRTLQNRNNAALATAPSAPPPQAEPKTSVSDRFGYEKESWDKEKQEQQPPPQPQAIPDRSTEELRTLNQELFQLLDKCLNR